MRLPRFIAPTTPSAGTGLVRASDIGALTDTGSAEFAAIAGAGKALQGVAGLAFRAYQNRQALDDQVFAGEADKRAFDAHKEGMGTYIEFDPSIGNTNPNDPKSYYDGTKIINFNNAKKEEFLNLTYKDYEVKIPMYKSLDDVPIEIIFIYLRLHSDPCIKCHKLERCDILVTLNGLCRVCVVNEHIDGMMWGKHK